MAVDPVNWLWSITAYIPELLLWIATYFVVFLIVLKRLKLLQIAVILIFVSILVIWLHRVYKALF